MTKKCREIGRKIFFTWLASKNLVGSEPRWPRASKTLCTPLIMHPQYSVFSYKYISSRFYVHSTLFPFKEEEATSECLISNWHKRRFNYRHCRPYERIIAGRLLQVSHLITRRPRRASNHVNTSNFANTAGPPPSE